MNPTTPPNQPEEVKIHQDDPLLQQKVASFIQAAGGVVSDKEKVEIPVNKDFDIPNPDDAILTAALIDPKTVTVNDSEKAVFIKSLLNDEPVRLKIEIYDGQIRVDLRSRTIHEQRRIFDVLFLDEKAGIVHPANTALFVTRMQQYCMLLMIERFNDQVFSDLQIGIEIDDVTAQAKFHEALKKTKLAEMNGPKWTAMLNAMRIFEAKCATLSTECANADFWKPRETV